MKEKNQSGKYILVFAITVVLGLIIIAGLNFTADPLYQYHMPWFGREVYADDGVYQNPGLAKNADYNGAIVGSSMSMNFNCEWFDEAYDINTLKLTYTGCTAKDWVNSVDLAGQKNVRYIFGNIDFYVLTRYKYDETRWELPEYLYDDNYFNDVNYLLNKNILFERTMNVLKNNYAGNLKNAYAWYDDHTNFFGHYNVLKHVNYNGECKDIKQKQAVIDHNAKQSVQQIKETVLKYPDTTFVLFYSPFSLIYYYDRALDGDLDISMKVYEYSMKELLECENCKLYFPAYNNIEMMTDLDSYEDLAHYDIDIQYLIFEEMRDGVNMVTKENYTDIINWLRNTVMNYNYKELYEKYR